MNPEALDPYPGLDNPIDAEIIKSDILYAMLNVAIAMENIALQEVSLGLGTYIVQLMREIK
jgi:nitroreductase